MNQQHTSIRPWSRLRGFTLIELLVVIAIIGILAALLFPVLSKAKNSAQGASCLNSGKQMMVAMHLYIGENEDFFPPNPDDGNIIPGHNWCGGQAGIGGAQEFNPDVLEDPTRSLLIGYLGKSSEMFRCPSDKRSGIYQGTKSVLIGHTINAARTYSMNQAVGTICPGFDATHNSHSGTPDRPVNGSWLDNSFHHRRETPWHTYGKLSGINTPGPSMLWILLDEDANGLNDAAFAVGMEKPGWIDYPGTYHNSGCGFAFADGHSETHRWIDESTRFGSPASTSTNPNDWHDWQWITKRTSASIAPPKP